MWNQKDTRDAGRFVLHQAGWDDKSALGRYNPAHNSDFRVAGPYGGGRGYSDPGFLGENGYDRGGFHRDMLVERDRYQMAPPPMGTWPSARGTTYEDEIGVIRGPQRHAKASFGDAAYRDMHSFRESGDSYRDANNFREGEKFREVDKFREREHDLERGGRYFDAHRQGFDGDEYSYKRPAAKSSREGSWDRDYVHSRYGDVYDSDHEKDRKDRSQRKLRKRDKEKQRSKERDESPDRGRRRERSWSRSRSRSRSRSHEHRSRRSRSSSRGYTRDKRERSHEDAMYSTHIERKRNRDERRHRDYHAVAPSATLVVKGLSQRTVEDDIYQALVDWGPLRHVRVIKERSTGTSRGFAFVDFPSVDAARKMMDDVGDNGLVVDGRRLFFEYSSKPTGGVGGPQVDVATTNGSTAASAVDWMCLVCGCVNFARRTSCFQCNEARTDDAPPADVSTVIPSALARKGSEAGPTHVLVVRGLDENVNEEILHYEFSKYAPLKDLRLVRDKFTHISKGFAFVHFHSVEDATKALEASNGTALDKNGQLLRVAYAKSIYGPGASSSSNTQGGNSLAAAAIEAATFAQQYDAVGWAPKEYNADQAKDGGGKTEDGEADPNVAPQAGFVWDEASGYYYDAVSGFYYDGHRGLYYDGNHGIWYTFNQETQQYEPYAGQEGETGNTNAIASSTDNAANHQSASFKTNTNTKPKDVSTSRKAVISAPPSTIHVEQDSKLGIAEAVKAAAIAAKATMKKDKSRKALLTSSKTKIGGVSAMWKQNKEAQLDQSSGSALKASLVDDKSKNVSAKPTSTTASTPVTPTVPKKIQGVIHTKQTVNRGAAEDALFASESRYSSVKSSSLPISGFGITSAPKKLEGVIHSRDDIGGAGVSTSTKKFEGVIHSRDEAGSFGAATVTKKLEGVIRSREGSAFSAHSIGHGVGNLSGGDYLPSESTVKARQVSTIITEDRTSSKADASAIALPVAGGRRRFTEAPQAGYRDRAAERRNLHGTS